MLNFIKIGSSLHSDHYRPDIDGIRAIAVIAVILCHYFPEMLPGGFIGVDIFFVISGYLISSILIRDIGNNSFSILNFYNRRIKRIFPALFVVLLFITLFGWFCLFKHEYMVLGRHIAASTLFSENILLWSESGYFDVSSEMKPTLHLWSLAIEEQFYIFWPILMFLAARWRVNFFLMFAIFAGVSFGINLHDVNTDPTAAYYSPFGRSWELMVGSCLAYTQSNHPELLARFKNFQSCSGIILITLALIFIRSDNGFPGYWALLPTIGTFFLISGGAHAWVNRYVLSVAPMVWCGLISYPLYLWHWPLLSFGYITFDLLSLPLKITGIVLAIITATFTFLFIERPFRVQVKAEPVSKTKMACLVVSMAVVLGSGVLIMTQLIAPRLVRFDAPTETEWDFLKNRTVDFDKNGVGSYSFAATRSNLVLFIGDSHIAQYAGRLDKVITGDLELPGAILEIGGGCIPIEDVKTDNLFRIKCWPLRKQAFAMAEEERFHTIVIGAAWNWYFLNSEYSYEANGKSIPLSSTDGKKAALERLGQRIRQLIGAGKKVIVILDNPASIEFNPSGRANRLGLSASNFKSNGTMKMDTKQYELRQELLEWVKKTGANVIDPVSALCVGEVCPVTTLTGQPLYKDRGHFNPAWVIDHADFIDAAVNKR